MKPSPETSLKRVHESQQGLFPTNHDPTEILISYAPATSAEAKMMCRIVQDAPQLTVWATHGGGADVDEGLTGGAGGRNYPPIGATETRGKV